MSQLKDIYNSLFITDLSKIIKKSITDFDLNGFNNKVFDKRWGKLELKQRMKHIALTLDSFLEKDYTQKSKQILKIVSSLKESNLSKKSLELMFIPELIEAVGLEDYEKSITLIEETTKLTSCEFVVRPFLIKYQDKMINQMLDWSKSENYHVRRLSSEGSRPRLPWAIALNDFKKDPTPILDILENLKNDDYEYVRRSVANNLNDISKDNPEIVLKVVRSWKNHSEKTNWIIKHACRTLLKQGNQEALNIFGFEKPKEVKVDNLIIEKVNIKVGDYLKFNFDLKNISKSKVKIRLEYSIYFLKANKNLSKKVFKISEKEYDSSSINKISRKQSFKLISTRKYYKGEHQIGIVVNGHEFCREKFYLSI